MAPFKTPVNHQTDSFQDPMFIYNTKLFKLTPFKTPTLDYIVFSFFMGNTLQIDSVKTPWETTFRKLVLSGPFYTVNFRLLSRPLHCVKHCFHSPWETPFKLTVLNLHGRLPSGNWFLQDHFAQWILDSFQDHLGEEKNTEHIAVQFQWPFGLLSRPCIGNQDTGQTGQTIHHHHHTVEGT